MLFLYILLILLLYILIIYIFFKIGWIEPIYAMDTKTAELLQIGDDIAYWQSDLDSLQNYKNTLLQNKNSPGMGEERFSSLLQDVDENIADSKKNITSLIKRKLELQKELNIFNSSSILGKRSN